MCVCMCETNLGVLHQAHHYCYYCLKRGLPLAWHAPGRQDYFTEIGTASLCLPDTGIICMISYTDCVNMDSEGKT